MVGFDDNDRAVFTPSETQSSNIFDTTRIAIHCKLHATRIVEILNHYGDVDSSKPLLFASTERGHHTTAPHSAPQHVGTRYIAQLTNGQRERDSRHKKLCLKLTSPRTLLKRKNTSTLSRGFTGPFGCSNKVDQGS